jgi:predicted RNase H-like nuclease (RuvC/YqgF family)
MQKRVQRKEVDVVINQKESPHKGKIVKETASYDTPPKQRHNQQHSNAYNSGGGKVPSGFNLPNPDELAQRYGVEDALSPNSPTHYGPDQAEYERQSAMNEELANVVQSLKRKVDEKNRKIEHLCVLLESLEPVPGVDPNRVQGLAAGMIGEDQVDLRDAKIVSLAKKSHNLQMVVNKERAKSEKLSQEVEEARKRIQALNQELELQKAANLAASKPERVYNRHALVDEAKKNEEEEQKMQTQKQLKEALRNLDDVKEKLKKANEDNKKLSKALEREIGDGVALEQAVDGGWRGRAQQIVMLKSKV